jgi:hypothetical protein
MSSGDAGPSRFTNNNEVTLPHYQSVETTNNSGNPTSNKQSVGSLLNLGCQWCMSGEPRFLPPPDYKRLEQCQRGKKKKKYIYILYT